MAVPAERPEAKEKKKAYRSWRARGLDSPFHFSERDIVCDRHPSMRRIDGLKVI
jgi:hypothetical protein